MFQRLVHTTVMMTLAVALGAATVQPAEAGRSGRIAAGVAAGIIGLGILGIHSRGLRQFAAAPLRALRTGVLSRPAPLPLGWAALLARPLR